MSLCEFLTTDGRVVGISAHYVVAVEPAPDLPKANRRKQEPVACALVICAGGRSYTVIGSQKRVTAKIRMGD